MADTFARACHSPWTSWRTRRHCAPGCSGSPTTALDLLRSGAIRAAEPIEAAHEVADPGSPILWRC